MGAPTPPDQTPDIRLSMTSAADLEAATTPNGHQKIAIEPTADADLGFKMLVHCDDDGVAYKALAKDEPARVTDLEATGIPTFSAVSAGVAVVDGSGIVSSVPGLTGLNFTLGTSIDESSSARTPTAHKTTHENGGADEISVAGLSGELADAQPTTRQKAYDGGNAVGLATNHHTTRLKADAGNWIITDEAGTRQVLKAGQKTVGGVAVHVDAEDLHMTANGAGDIDLTVASFNAETAYGNVTVHNSDLGVEIASPNRVASAAPNIELDADKDGALYGDITAKAEGDISLAAEETFEASSGTGAGVIAGDASGYLWHTQPHVTTATRLGDRFMAVDDSDTDDSTVNIAITDCRDILMKGTAINRWHVLPDATSLTAGTVVFVFRNWSREIRGVRNSDSTLWLRIMPSQTAIVFLTAGGTAVGVWGAELSTINPDYGFQNVEDGVGGTSGMSYTSSGIYAGASGTGAVARFTAMAPVTGSATGTQGLFQISTGTDATGGGYFVFYNASLVAGQGMPLRFFSDRCYFLNAANATDDYVFDIGFGDVGTAGDHADGAWLRYDRANHATNWRSGVAGGGSATVADTETAVPIATLFDLNMEIASDSSRFDVWMNRVLIATVTGANIPTTAEYFGMVCKMYNTAGTANDRNWYSDRLGIMGAKNKRRGLA